ncbi:hypothetical protein [Citrobacter meridianamericanus]|uniref:hypothetical protein n=1 Tax=Citrobacter meridianamericanus TaxID=2894201 RepID=UPI00351D4A3A
MIKKAEILDSLLWLGFIEILVLSFWGLIMLILQSWLVGDVMLSYCFVAITLVFLLTVCYLLSFWFHCLQCAAFVGGGLCGYVKK